jgi:hypothetical protein
VSPSLVCIEVMVLRGPSAFWMSVEDATEPELVLSTSHATENFLCMRKRIPFNVA